MPSPPPKIISRSRVTTAIIVNLTATPGLGSWMCRRWWAGAGQLIFSVSGFGLIMWWMLRLIYRSTMEQLDNPLPSPPAAWMWKWGVLLFGLGWLWSVVTSISLWREAGTNERLEQKNAPPRITNLPDKM